MLPKRFNILNFIQLLCFFPRYLNLKCLVFKILYWRVYSNWKCVHVNVFVYVCVVLNQQMESQYRTTLKVWNFQSFQYFIKTRSKFWLKDQNMTKMTKKENDIEKEPTRRLENKLKEHTFSRKGIIRPYCIRYFWWGSWAFSFVIINEYRNIRTLVNEKCKNWKV